MATGVRSAMCAPLWYTSGHQLGGRRDRPRVRGLPAGRRVLRRGRRADPVGRSPTSPRPRSRTCGCWRRASRSAGSRRTCGSRRRSRRGCCRPRAPLLPGYDVWWAPRGPAGRWAGTTSTSTARARTCSSPWATCRARGPARRCLMTVLRASVRGHWREPSASEAVGAHQPHGVPERAREQVHHVLPGAGSTPPSGEVRVRQRRPQPAAAGARGRQRSSA